MLDKWGAKLVVLDHNFKDEVESFIHLCDGVCWDPQRI